MIVTDGGTWVNSKAICAVGHLRNGSFPVRLYGSGDTIFLRYSDVNWACAVRISIILRLDSKDDIGDTNEFLLSQALKDGYEIKDVLKHLKEINRRKSKSE